MHLIKSANFYLVLILSILLGTGCADNHEKEVKAINFVSSQIGATKAEISFTDYKDTDGRSMHRTTLNFKELEAIPKDYYPEQITSTAALLYLKQLDKDDYKDVVDINVILQIKPKSFEKTYRITELYEAEQYLSIVDKFMVTSGDNDLPGVKSTVDAKYITDSSLVNILATIAGIDSAYGKITHTTYTGFHFGEAEEINEPVFISWLSTEQEHSNLTTKYKFVFSTVSKKVIYVSLNENE